MTPKDQSAYCRDLALRAPVIPVITVSDPDAAVPLAEALVAGGLAVLEVTLRTPVALDAITAMGAVPGAVVGAGTVLSPADLRAAKAAGARFAVSPGSSAALIEASVSEALPLLPGGVTATEVMALIHRGYTMAKFFPAEASGGAASVKALGAPLPQIAFCPTGGVTPDNARDYLALPNVVCVGGSWMLPGEKIASGDWDGVERLARTAAALR
ncbi:MAG: bifunctional 4-hydroxy-2-oxoglutarate aldolase/2-dehydro-3-deoxy-phosphogluconate aldolase [Rhodobacteraceae bacterium]|nr:bifunctional 4-hydroxy-2-oxoglutarate aldolase/2-dehydro-3-deoxy-phosphogluconate aldolase [Paracoccaceae bacterium]